MVAICFCKKNLAYYQVLSLIVLVLSFFIIGSLPREMMTVQAEVVLPEWEVYQFPLVIILLISIICFSLIFGFKRGIKHGIRLVEKKD